MTHSRATQRGQMLDLLKSRAGQWIPLPEILALGFAQFGARILELRRSGHTILNRTEHRDGKVLSWYKLELSANKKQMHAAPRGKSRHGGADFFLGAPQSMLFAASSLPERWVDPEEGGR